jgi:hypothetical protein
LIADHQPRRAKPRDLNEPMPNEARIRTAAALPQGWYIQHQDHATRLLTKASAELIDDEAWRLLSCLRLRVICLR